MKTIMAFADSVSLTLEYISAFTKTGADSQRTHSNDSCFPAMRYQPVDSVEAYLFVLQCSSVYKSWFTKRNCLGRDATIYL